MARVAAGFGRGLAEVRETLTAKSAKIEHKQNKTAKRRINMTPPL
jgi:hypothetical protein